MIGDMTALVDANAERTVLCSWMDGVQPEGIDDSMFWSDQNSRIAKALTDGLNVPTAETLAKYSIKLESWFSVAECGIKDYNGSSAKSVRSLYFRRKAIEQRNKDLQRLCDLTEDAGDLIEEMSPDSESTFSRAEIAKSAHRAASLAGSFSTGLRQLNKVLNTFSPGEHLVIAGRSHTGKTALGMQLCNGAWETMGLRTLFFSLEMTDYQIAKRAHDQAFYLAQSDYEVDRVACEESWKQTRGKVEKIELNMSEGIFANYTARTVEKMVAAVRRARSRGQIIDMVMIDYQQLMEAKGANKNEQMTLINVGIKNRLCKDLGLRVISLCQLSRKSTDGSSRPGLDHLRDSGSIEENADAVLLLWHQKDKPRWLWIEDAKNRMPGSHEPRILEKRGVTFFDPPNDLITQAYTAWNDSQKKKSYKQ